MSEVVDSYDTGFGLIERKPSESKVKEYDLEDLIISMHLEGHKSSKIARECNEVLKKRTDGKTYIKINATNVLGYINKHKNELARSDPNAIKLMNDAMPDVADNLTSLVNTLQDEIGKIRNVDSPILDSKSDFFIRLLDRLQKAIETTANIKGMLQPQIMNNIFLNIENNITKLANKVRASPTLSDEAKDEVINLISEEFITNMMKSIDVTVIEDKKK